MLMVAASRLSVDDALRVDRGVLVVMPRARDRPARRRTMPGEGIGRPHRRDGRGSKSQLVGHGPVGVKSPPHRKTCGHSCSPVDRRSPRAVDVVAERHQRPWPRACGVGLVRYRSPRITTVAATTPPVIGALPIVEPDGATLELPAWSKWHPRYVANPDYTYARSRGCRSPARRAPPMAGQRGHLVGRAYGAGNPGGPGRPPNRPVDRGHYLPTGASLCAAQDSTTKSPPLDGRTSSSAIDLAVQ